MNFIKKLSKVNPILLTTWVFAASLSGAAAHGVDSDLQLPSQWKKCGDQNSECHIDQPGDYAVRYGYADKEKTTFYAKEYYSDKPLTIQCNNKNFGDPRDGAAKYCEYRPILNADTNYEQRTCKTDKEYAGGAKSCTYTASNANWTQCAKEGKSCETVTGGLVVLRYGTYETGEWSERNWMSTGEKMKCSNSNWGFDPAKGHNKICQFTTIPDEAMRTVYMNWVPIQQSCDNCSNPTITTSIGVDVTEGEASSSSFSVSVSEQINGELNLGAKGKVFKGGIKIGAEISSEQAWAWANTVSRTTQLSQSVSTQFECIFDDVRPNNNVSVYQFVTSGTRIGAGDVNSGEIRDSSFVCLQTPAGQQLNTPACFPNYFDPNDPTGQKCLEGGDLPTFE